MKVVITGSSGGIGRAVAEKFLAEGHEVIGLDVTVENLWHPRYTHLVCDITGNLPEIEGVEILVNCAGVQTMTMEDIRINLMGVMAVTEKYAFQPAIRGVVNVASSSGSTGAEFPEYAAGKGGLIAYTKNAAMRLAKYGAVCNSLSPGGVITEMNRHILDDKVLYEAVLNESLLHRWAEPSELADWIYFLAVVNKSMTAQDLLVDNGEAANFNFIW